MDHKLKEVDISVGTNIYGTFKNLSYSVHSAISEFIDNSIASFRENEKVFDNAIKKGQNIEKSITLLFDRFRNQLIIRDSAFGIKNNEIERALKLKMPPKDTSGLNEFGMGLKTGSFWFGEEVEIISKSPIDAKGFKVSLKLSELEKGKDSVSIISTDDYKTKWKLGQGTIIIIKKISENRDISNTMAKSVVNRLASKYRRDILNGKIIFRAFSIEKNKNLIDLIAWEKTGEKQIRKDQDILKGEPLSYSETKRWTDENTQNGYEIQFSFNIKFMRKRLAGKATFFIRQTGSRSEAGFDLFRRGRIIEEKNKNFITDASSFSYQRINGWIDLDDFPVAQAKDKFDWDGKLFEDTKKSIIENEEFKEIVRISSKLRKRSNNNEKDALKNQKSFEEKLLTLPFPPKILNDFEREIVANEIGIPHSKSDSAHEITTTSGETKTIYSRLITDNKLKSWMDIKEIDNTIIVAFDVNHHFFNPFNEIKGNGDMFITIMRMFVVYWAQAEIESLEHSETVDIFRNRMAKLINMNMNEGEND